MLTILARLKLFTLVGTSHVVLSLTCNEKRDFNVSKVEVRECCLESNSGAELRHCKESRHVVAHPYNVDVRMTQHCTPLNQKPTIEGPWLGGSDRLVTNGSPALWHLSNLPLSLCVLKYL